MSVLIIDDEDIILQTLGAVFRRERIPTETESDPVEALRRFEKNVHNIVLVDVLMPKMAGAQVIRQVKRISPMCNIIVMTAFSNMTHVVECIEAGAVDYITKPFADFNLLLTIVRTSIERVERWRRSFGLEIRDGNDSGATKLRGQA